MTREPGKTVGLKVSWKPGSDRVSCRLNYMGTQTQKEREGLSLQSQSMASECSFLGQSTCHRPQAVTVEPDQHFSSRSPRDSPVSLGWSVDTRLPASAWLQPAPPQNCHFVSCTANTDWRSSFTSQLGLTGDTH